MAFRKREPNPARQARAKAPALRAASVGFFDQIRQQVDDSGIVLEKESVLDRPEKKVPSNMAKSGSYLLRVYQPVEQPPTKITIGLPRQTRLTVSQLGVISYATANDPANKLDLWTPEHETRFIDPEDIGEYADFQFGKPLLTDTSLSVRAPFGYFSNEAQTFMHTMFDDTLRIIRTDQLHAATPAGNPN